MDSLSGALSWFIAAWAGLGAAVLAVAVARDARARGHSALAWGLCALLLPGFGALAYLVQRRDTAGVAAAQAQPAAMPFRPPVEAITEASPSPVTLEWQRGQGAAVVRGPASPAPASPPASASRRWPGWLTWGGAAVAVVGCGLAVGLGVGSGALSGQLGPPAPAATPTARPSPTPAPLPTPALVEVPIATPTASEPLYHTVVEGDTLGDIALRYQTTIEALLAANDLDDADHIVVGQRLRIPSP